jgi:hypothetical protein
MFVNGSPVTQMWDGFVEGDGQPRPSVAAYATMTWLLDGAKFERTEHAKPNLWLHRFTTPKGTVVVAWARTGQTVAQRFPGATQAWDVMGATVKLKGEMLAVTDAPMYVLLKGR